MKEEVIPMKNNKIYMAIIFVLIIIIIFLLFWGRREATIKTVEATVQYVGEDYLVVVDQEGIEYSIETDETFQVGDQLSFDIRKINQKKKPIEGDVTNVKALRKNIQFEIDDPSPEVTDPEPVIDSSDNGNNSNNENTPKPTSPSSSLGTEEAVVSYLTQLEHEVDSTNQITSSIKSGFVTVIDFLFYNGTIQGKTFAELTTTAKLKILKLALNIDQKIEKKFPNYKEEIKSTGGKLYTNVKAKILEVYLDTTTKICKNHEDTCESAKEGLRELKQSFSLTWNFIKEISGVGVTKLKDWYEVWRES